MPGLLRPTRVRAGRTPRAQPRAPRARLLRSRDWRVAFQRETRAPSKAKRALALQTAVTAWPFHPLDCAPSIREAPERARAAVVSSTRPLLGRQRVRLAWAPAQCQARPESPRGGGGRARRPLPGAGGWQSGRAASSFVPVCVRLAEMQCLLRVRAGSADRARAHTRTDTHTRTRARGHTQTRICTCTHMRVHTHAHTRARGHAHTHARAHAHTCPHTHAHAHTCARARTRGHTHRHPPPPCAASPSGQVGRRMARAQSASRSLALETLDCKCELERQSPPMFETF